MYLGYYGKLPEFGDFIKSEAMSPTAEAYIQWLDVSFSRVMTAFGEGKTNEFDNLSPIGLVIKIPEAPTAMIGHTIPSCDKAGRRSPFTIFADVSNDRFTNELACLPAAHRLFFTLCEQAIADKTESFRFERQRDTVWRLEQTLQFDINQTRNEFSNWVARTTVGDFIKSFQNDPDISSRLIENTIFALFSAKSSISDQFQAIFRFPLSGNDESRLFEISFWVQLTEAVIGKPLGCQALFWQQNRFDIVFHLPAERMLPLTWIKQIEDDNIWEFKVMDFESTPPEEIPADKVGDIIGNEETYISDLISKAGQS